MPPPAGRRLLMLVNHAGFFLSHRLPLALAARDAGYEVHIATPRSKHVPLIEKEGLAWHPVRLTRSGTNPFAEVRAVADIVGLYRTVRPDIVHHVTTKPVLYGTTAARLTGVRAVVNAMAGLGHLSLAEDLFHRALGRAVRLGFRVMLRHPRMKVIFQNEDDRGSFVGAGILREPETVIVPGSGVDPNIFRPRNGARHEPPVVMLPSRMLYTKGVEEFVAAARTLKAKGVDARFVLVGEPDPDNPASIAESVLDAWKREAVVECWGRRGDMPAVYAQGDIVVLPSYREGMPKVLIETASCGLPAVTTDVPGCRDVVVQGETGLLVPVRDGGVAIAAGVEALLADPALCTAMGERARARVLDRFALDRILAQTLSIYGDLLA